MMLAFKLGKNIGAIVNPNNSFPWVVFKVVGAAIAEGWIDRLIYAAMQYKPESPKLRAFTYEIGFTSSKPSKQELEAISNKLPPLK